MQYILQYQQEFEDGVKNQPVYQPFIIPYCATYEQWNNAQSLFKNRTVLSKHIFQSTITPIMRKLDVQGMCQFTLSDTLMQALGKSEQSQFEFLKMVAFKD